MIFIVIVHWNPLFRPAQMFNRGAFCTRARKMRSFGRSKVTNGMQIRGIFQHGSQFVTQMSWNYNLLLCSVYLFCRQRIHFKCQLFIIKLFSSLKRITEPSNISQSELSKVTKNDPRRIITLNWRHQEDNYRNPWSVIGWDSFQREYALFSSNRKEIRSPTRLHFPYLVTK